MPFHPCRKKHKKEKKEKVVEENEHLAEESGFSTRPRKRKTPAEIAFEEAKRKKVNMAVF